MTEMKARPRDPYGLVLLPGMGPTGCRDVADDQRCSSMISRVSASALPVGARFVNNPRSQGPRPRDARRREVLSKQPGARSEKLIAIVW